MRQLTRVICCAAAVLAMTACGAQSSSTGSGSPPSTGSGSPPSQPTVFPVTITRTGGIAGFQDVVVVAGDGQVSVTRKGQQQRRCQLTPGAVERLRAAASQVPWALITAASTKPAFPDDMVTMVRSPAGGPARLEDPKVGAGGKAFQELLSDVSGATAPRLCKAA
jgi:hypothetical protein